MNHYISKRFDIDWIPYFRPSVTKCWIVIVCRKKVTEPKAKRCADILQSLVEEVEANIASTIYREEPLQPLAMPADMDKSLRAAAGYCIALGEIGQVLENISHGKHLFSSSVFIKVQCVPGSIPRMFSGKLCIWLIRFDKPISAVSEIFEK